jgi:S-adenosylmethionine hydrolase
MASQGIVTLLSDFGWQDGYVGIIKGAIACINPQLSVIDITHQIPAHNIAAGRFCLMNAYLYFPRETVHVAIVDPGVGSQRRGVAVALQEGFLVGPDNGLLSGVLNLSSALAAVELTQPRYWRVRQPSSTFHGRDIFAPVGAHLASGVPLEALGNPIPPESLVQLAIPSAQVQAQEIVGSIQYIDIFGNLITNIPAAAVMGKTWSVAIADRTIPQGRAYSDVQPGECLGLIGSHGWLEIAANGESAQARLQVREGDRAIVKLGT